MAVNLIINRYINSQLSGEETISYLDKLSQTIKENFNLFLKQQMQQDLEPLSKDPYLLRRAIEKKPSDKVALTEAIQKVYHALCKTQSSELSKLLQPTISNLFETLPCELIQHINRYADFTKTPLIDKRWNAVSNQSWMSLAKALGLHPPREVSAARQHVLGYIQVLKKSIAKKLNLPNEIKTLLEEPLTLDTVRLLQDWKRKEDEKKLKNLPSNALRFSSKDLTHFSIKFIKKNDDLETLYLDDNRFWEFPTEIFNFLNLKILDLTSELPLRALPENIGDLKNLKKLAISCNVTKLPPSFAKLQELKELELDYCKQKKIPEEVCQLENLKILSIEMGDLECLPKTIANLQKLQHLTLICNSVGHLPKEIGKLEELKCLYIKTNQGFPSLPRELGELKNLEDCSFSVQNIPWYMDYKELEVDDEEGWTELTAQECKQLIALQEARNTLQVWKHLAEKIHAPYPKIEDCKTVKKTLSEAKKFESWMKSYHLQLQSLEEIENTSERSDESFQPPRKRAKKS